MNTGHVRKKTVSGKPRWYVTIEGGRDPATGKRRQRSLGGYGTKTEATKALRDSLGRMDTGTFVEPSKLTLGQYLTDTWLPAQEDQLRPSTWDSYRRNLDLHVIPQLGTTTMQALTPGQLNSLYRQMRDRGLSDRGIRYVHTITRKALAKAVMDGLVMRNVASLATPPKQVAAGKPQMRTWTAAQLGAFLAAVEGERLAPAFTLAALTGMRRGEVLGLRWEDVDLDASRLSVRQTLISVAYKPQLSTPKTKKGRRSIPLEARAVAALKSWRKAQLEERMAAGAAWQDTGLVFSREDGSWVHPERFSQVFDTVVSRLADSDMPRIRLHDLRHTWATLALQAGVPVKVVSEILGHASVSITYDTYSHVIPFMLDDAASRVGALIPLTPADEAVGQ